MSPATHTQVLNFVIRMVVPMRREFGRSLDVQRFMHEPAYAQTVIDEALASRDQRLREYAAYVQRHLLGPRDSAPRPEGGEATTPMAFDAAAPEAPAANPAAAPGEAAEPTEAELRERVLKKYTGGLR